MEGMALEDCGDELGIRRTTVRMHLRNIFAKTGARRQGELVALLLKSIGLGPRLK
jgi:DNA-binding CsgD family transcriptional regulator